MKIFEPSSFWTYLMQRRLIHVIWFCVILGLSIEVIARVAPLLVGNFVHQPFLRTFESCELCAEVRDPIVWQANERGARGNLYHGERPSGLALRDAHAGRAATAGPMHARVAHACRPQRLDPTHSVPRADGRPG